MGTRIHRQLAFTHSLIVSAPNEPTHAADLRDFCHFRAVPRQPVPAHAARQRQIAPPSPLPTRTIWTMIDRRERVRARAAAAAAPPGGSHNERTQLHSHTVSVRKV